METTYLKKGVSLPNNLEVTQLDQSYLSKMISCTSLPISETDLQFSSQKKALLLEEHLSAISLSRQCSSHYQSAQMITNHLQESVDQDTDLLFDKDESVILRNWVSTNLKNFKYSEEPEVVESLNQQVIALEKSAPTYEQLVEQIYGVIDIFFKDQKKSELVSDSSSQIQKSLLKKSVSQALSLTSEYIEGQTVTVESISKFRLEESSSVTSSLESLNFRSKESKVIQDLQIRLKESFGTNKLLQECIDHHQNMIEGLQRYQEDYSVEAKLIKSKMAKEISNLKFKLQREKEASSKMSNQIEEFEILSLGIQKDAEIVQRQTRLIEYFAAGIDEVIGENSQNKISTGSFLNISEELNPALRSVINIIDEPYIQERLDKIRGIIKKNKRLEFEVEKLELEKFNTNDEKTVGIMLEDVDLVRSSSMMTSCTESEVNIHRDGTSLKHEQYSVLRKKNLMKNLEQLKKAYDVKHREASSWKK